MSRVKNTADMINDVSDIEEEMMNTLEDIAVETTQNEAWKENIHSEMSRESVSFRRSSNVLPHVIGVSKGERKVGSEKCRKRSWPNIFYA